MPAKDIYHELVKRALIKSGWTITQDPLRISWGNQPLFVDLAASQFIVAENAERQIAVEVKSFASRSKIADFEGAIGQYIIYWCLLDEKYPHYNLYLAVPESAYVSLFAEARLGDLVRRKIHVPLIVFDPDREEISRWIN